MDPVSSIVVFVLTWWVVLFTVLPWGVRGQYEDGDMVAGTEPGAPVQASLKRKLVITTLIATGVWAVFTLNAVFGLITLEDLGFPPLNNPAE